MLFCHNAAKFPTIIVPSAIILNTGIGWHEARIPTIAQAVPRGAGVWQSVGALGKLQRYYVDAVNQYAAVI